MAVYIPSTHIDITEKSRLTGLSFTAIEGFSGAAIAVTKNGDLTISNSFLVQNNANYFGGAVFCEGKLTVTNGVFFTGNTAQYAGAVYNTGTTGISNGMFSQNSSLWTGGALENWSSLTVAGSTFSLNESAMGGALFNGSGTASFTSCLFAGNSSATDGGAIENYAVLNITGSTFSGNTAAVGGAIDNTDGGKITLKSVCFDGNTASTEGGAIYNGKGSKITIEDTLFLTPSDTIANYGSMTFSGTVSLAGTLTTDSVITASDVSIVFDISRYDEAGNNTIIEDLMMLNGIKDFSLNVAPDQVAVTYTLAGNASLFDDSVTLKCEEYPVTMLTVDLGDTATFHNNVYTISLNGSALEVELKSYETSATAEQLTWNEINDAVSYAVELSGGSHTIEVGIGTQGADLLGLANGDYTWQVRNIEEEDNRQNGEAFSQSSAPQEPQILSAETNTLTDVFFANVDGVWGKGFEAMHVGCKDGWTGTLETVNLAGKSRITDIFAGSDDASVLVQTDDSENGMALFVDDIYSAACGTPEQARLSKIDTIYATAGDDIIDLTSQSFGFANGVTVYGGTGNDVIWANSKENMLFGEAGDDRIVGGNEDDVIIGGIGNDTLHGGGGADIFCFGDGWGVDTVEQLASGSVVLWFNENSGTWDETTLTYTQGDNSVSVFGVASVELRFGAADGHEEQYAVLSATGAFA